jgi:tetratricopeptide (TPR) repeat protein
MSSHRPGHHVLRSSLQIPDDPAWSGAAGYFPPLAAALDRAYRFLKRAPSHSDDYYAAYREVIPYRSLPVSLQQQMHLEYVLAQAYMGTGDLPEALASANKAMELAEDLHDHTAGVELWYLGGAAKVIQNAPREAADYFVRSLVTLWDLDQGDGPVDPAFELDLLIRLAATEYEQANYDSSALYLHEARALARTWVPDDTLQSATIVWLDAQLLRWAGDLSKALSTAMGSAEIFDRMAPSSTSAGRIQIIVAETALDLAESFASDPPSHAQLAYVGLAESYAQHGRDLCRASDDAIGQGLAQLALQRIGRLRGQSEHRIGVIEDVARTARQVGDIALLGRSQASLGDEFETLRQYTAARNSYQRAWRLLEEHDLRAMAKWPHRSFLHLAERDV